MVVEFIAHNIRLDGVLLNILYYHPQDFNNICMIARTLDVLGLHSCYVYDPRRLIRERYGRSNTQRIIRISAGAYSHIRFIQVTEPASFLQSFPHRKIATVATGDAIPLPQMKFQADDLLVFGSEARGLPDSIRSLCDAAVTIPQQGATQSLNLAVATGIILYECLRQQTDHGSGGEKAPPQA